MPSEQVKSVLEQIDQFGNSEDDFEAYMHIVAPVIQSYCDVGKFRSMARSMWLSGNKGGLKKLIPSITDGPTLIEQEREIQAELLAAKLALEKLVAFQINNLLGMVGFRKGDVLTVHGADGKERVIIFTGDLPQLGQDYAEWVKEVAPEQLKKQLEKMFGENALG